MIGPKEAETSPLNDDVNRKYIWRIEPNTVGEFGPPREPMKSACPFIVCNVMHKKV